MVPRLAAWCFTRRRLTVLLWIVAVVAITFAGSALKGDYRADYGAPGSDSQHATEVLTAHQKDRAGDTFDIVYEAPQGVADPAFQAQLEKFKNDVKNLADKEFQNEQKEDGAVAIKPNRIVSFGEPLVAQEGPLAGKIGSINVLTDYNPNLPAIKFGKDLIELRTEANKELEGGAHFELGGQIPAAGEQKPSPAETIGFIAAIIILFIAFGSALAMGVPIGLAAVSLAVATGLFGIIARYITTPEWAPIIADMIGIGVGIDYSLFIVTRYRTGLKNGLAPREAVIVAMNTAGRAVIFAGGTVVISLLGLSVMKQGYLYGVAVSASTAVLVVLISSVTLLPAILGFVGYRINGLRKQNPKHSEPDNPNSFWHRWSHAIQRRPWYAVIFSVLLLGLLTLPLKDLRLGFPDAGNSPKELTSRKAFDLQKEAFGPGLSASVYIVAELKNSGDIAKLAPLEAALRSDEGLVSVTPPIPSGDSAIAILIAQPSTSSQDKATETLIKRLRNSVIPESMAGTDIRVSVGGLTAGFIDSSRYIADRLILFIGAVVFLSFLLLMAVFRSIFVPIKAAIMNLLSISAAYGVMSFAVSGSWLGTLIGIPEATPIPSFVPMIMFAILFGLSMDYEVFLLSRVREEYLRTGDNANAVADGLAASARVITAAAAIMFCVFFAFVLDPSTFVKAIGLGLATAILVDATVVRLLLVPATMELLGDLNWWYPKWLDRITPHFHIDQEELVDLAGKDVAKSDASAFAESSS